MTLLICGVRRDRGRGGTLAEDIRNHARSLRGNRSYEQQVVDLKKWAALNAVPSVARAAINKTNSRLGS